MPKDTTTLRSQKPLWIATTEPVLGTTDQTQDATVDANGNVVNNVDGVDNRVGAHLWALMQLLCDIIELEHDPDGSHNIGTSGIQDGAITTPKLADGSVTDEKLHTTNTACTDCLLGFDGTDLAWKQARYSLEVDATSFHLQNDGDPNQGMYYGTPNNSTIRGWRYIQAEASAYMTIYVSNTGDDSNHGRDAANPVRTLAQAIRLIGPIGAIVLLSDIEVSSTLYIQNKNLTILKDSSLATDPIIYDDRLSATPATDGTDPAHDLSGRILLYAVNSHLNLVGVTVRGVSLPILGFKSSILFNYGTVEVWASRVDKRGIAFYLDSSNFSTGYTNSRDIHIYVYSDWSTVGLNKRAAFNFYRTTYNGRIDNITTNVTDSIINTLGSTTYFDSAIVGYCAIGALNIINGNVPRYINLIYSSGYISIGSGCSGVQLGAFISSVGSFSCRANITAQATSHYGLLLYDTNLRLAVIDMSWSSNSYTVPLFYVMGSRLTQFSSSLNINASAAQEISSLIYAYRQSAVGLYPTSSNIQTTGNHTAIYCSNSRVALSSNVDLSSFTTTHSIITEGVVTIGSTVDSAPYS